MKNGKNSADVLGDLQKCYCACGQRKENKDQCKN